MHLTARDLMGAAAATNGTDLVIPHEIFDFRLYRYEPSLPAAAVCIAVFGLLTAGHVWRIHTTRAFYFTPFAVGGVFQTIGYAGRVWSHYDPLALGGFIIQAILILVAPALYAASIYMILGRLIIAIRAEHMSLVPTKWLTKIFVTADVISFTLQAGGGGIQAGGTLKLYDIGEKVIIAGLFVQIVFFSLFLITAIVLHVRLRRTNPDAVALTKTAVSWRRHLLVLYVVSALILIRSIFRVVEYLQGNGGYLISHEVFLYIFDALLMAAVMALLLVFYVGDLDRERQSSTRIESAFASDDNAPSTGRAPVEMANRPVDIAGKA